MLSKEEKEMYEKQIKLIKEATEELKESNDAVRCAICGELVSEDYLIENNSITEGGRINVCEQCVIDGYGC